ncbi:MAG: hypothetical protein JHC12_04640 [Thermogladius sp.]|nr:hypothetical protein [Thermogladius sp.]
MRHLTISVTLSPSPEAGRVMSIILALIGTLTSRGYEVNVVYSFTREKDLVMVNGVALDPMNVEDRVVDVITNYIITEVAYTSWWKGLKGAS